LALAAAGQSDELHEVLHPLVGRPLVRKKTLVSRSPDKGEAKKAEGFKALAVRGRHIVLGSQLGYRRLPEQ
jgi:hypothetical protein